MNRINRIKIEGFRRLRSIDLATRPFCVLIGANGAGKTSLLDVFELLSNSAAGGLNKTLTKMSGITSILTRGQADALAFQVDMDVPDDAPIQYELKLGTQGTGYTITYETLIQKRPGFDTPFKHIESIGNRIGYYDIEERHLGPPTWEHDHSETSLSQVEKMFRQPAEFRRILGSATYFHALDVSQRAPVKLPQQMKPADSPGSNGEDLIPFLYYIRENDPDRFESIVDTLHAGFQNFDGLGFPPVAAGMLSLTMKDKHFPKPFYIHELSEGTLRFLWLTALLHSPNLPTITLIDEPEVSLHPELLNILVDLMREASERTQLVIATHSDRFVRFLHPNEVLALDIGEDGCTTAKWADEFDLDRWLAEYSLDEVWQMGRIGGRS